MQSIPYTVIGGYLGAGKTTLLNHLLARADGRRLALLINDFGAINIDAQLIETQTDQQINLTNGCVCCGLSDGFDAAIDQLLTSNANIEHIFVEASGVADVALLAQYGHAPGLALDSVLVVADAETIGAKASDKYVATTVKRQLRAADLIVLNKIDLVTQTRRNELLSWLGDLAPQARIAPATRCELPASLILHATNNIALDSETAPAQAASHHETYVTWSFERQQPLVLATVERFIVALPTAVLRGKGWFCCDRGTYAWQQVGQRSTLEPAPARLEETTQIVIIGLREQLEAIALNELAAGHFG